MRGRERIDMEDLFSIHPGIARTTTLIDAGEMMFDDEVEAASGCGGAATDCTDLIKAKIARHPRYPSLLSAYIDCRKVGAPPEMALLLEEIATERIAGYGVNECGAAAEIPTDPELDKFMDSYCRVLAWYKDELSKPFDEAASFLSSIETQFRSLCNPSSPSAISSSSAAASSPSAVTSPLPSQRDETNMFSRKYNHSSHVDAANQHGNLIVSEDDPQEQREEDLEEIKISGQTTESKQHNNRET